MTHRINDRTRQRKKMIHDDARFTIEVGRRWWRWRWWWWRWWRRWRDIDGCISDARVRRLSQRTRSWRSRISISSIGSG